MPESDYEHIERYLNDELSGEDKKEFEEQLKKDKKLRAEVRSYKEVNALLSRRLNLSEEEQRFRDQLQERRSQYFSPQSKIINFSARKLWWSSMASVAAVAAIILFLWAPWQQNLLRNYGQTRMTVPTVRGNEQNEGLTQAAQLFNNKKYKEALPLLDSLVRVSPSGSQNRFFRGVTYLHLLRDNKARQDFQTLFQGNSIYKYESAYFTALSFLQDGRKDSCIAWLHKIPQDAAVYPKAKKLLKRARK